MHQHRVADYAMEATQNHCASLLLWAYGLVCAKTQWPERKCVTREILGHLKDKFFIRLSRMVTWDPGRELDGVLAIPHHRMATPVGATQQCFS